jgi:hypothetical protein
MRSSFMMESTSGERTLRATTTTGVASATATISRVASRGPTRTTPAATAGADQDAVLVLRRRLLDAVHDLRVERIVELVEQNPHCAGPPAGEAAGHRVRPILQASRRFEHSGTALVADLRAAAHDERHK